jgi:RNA polymerase sigma factor (sigma-70 family)
MLESQSTSLGTIIRRLASPVEPEWTDADLLSAFIEQKDPTAFEAIVRRYGDMVFGVCCRVLQHQQDTEDAFQATFLVLFLKASSIQDRQTLSCWLYGVAFRTAMKAKSLMRKRKLKESQVSRPFDSDANSRKEKNASMEIVWEELEAVLDQEINALPEKYRKAILLCDLQGKSRKEAAQLLKCKEGTLSGHLARGRKILAQRLEGYGIGCSVSLLGLIWTQKVVADRVPHSLMNQTIALTRQIQMQNIVGIDSLPDSIVTLTNGVLKSMFFTQLRNVTAIFIAGITALVVGLSSFSGHAAPVPTEKSASSKEVSELQSKWKVNNPQLLLDHKVIRELKVTPDQREKIEDIYDAQEDQAEAVMEKGRKQLSELQRTDRETRATLAQEINSAKTKGYEKALKEVQDKVFKPEQIHRLAQIDLQFIGSRAFNDPQVIQTLQLTDKQKEEIQTLGKKALESLLPANPGAIGGGGAPGGIGGGGGGAVARATVRKEREEELVKSILGLLTKDQRTIWDEMVGKPVAFRKPSLGSFDMTGGFSAKIAPAVPIKR